MIVKIARESVVEYTIDLQEPTLLEALVHIKESVDTSLTFSSNCASSVCGSCAVRVNSKEVLACSYKLKDGDLVEPLRNLKVLRDLVVDIEPALECNSRAKTWLVPLASPVKQDSTDEAKTLPMSNCILCMACYSACPVYATQPDFLAPFSQTRTLRYTLDKRCEDRAEQLKNVQQAGIYDCTLCGECSVVCPQGISSKDDIVVLRNLSAMEGFVDPNFLSNFGSGLEF